MINRLSHFAILLLNFTFPGTGFAFFSRAISIYLYPITIVIVLLGSIKLGLIYEADNLKLAAALSVAIWILCSIHLIFVSRSSKEKLGTKKAHLLAIIIIWSSILLTSLFYRKEVLGLEIFYIQGSSMLPTLDQGDLIIVEIIKDEYVFDEGEILAFHSPNSNNVLIKRYAPLTQNDLLDQSALFLLGDNPAASIDSRYFGAISPTQIIGIAHIVVKKHFKLVNLANQSTILEY